MMAMLVLGWRGVVVVSAGHVGGTRGSGIVSSTADVPGMSVLRGMRGVGGVCEKCMCLARVGIGGEGVSGLGLGFTNHVGTGEGWTCVCVLWWCRWGVGRGLGTGLMLCLCESGFFV